MIEGSPKRMDAPLDTLTRLARKLTGRLSFEQTLSAVVEHATELLGVKRVSLRVLDASRSHLVAITRAGESLHDEPQPFRVGEGLLGWIAEHGQPLRLGDPQGDPRFATRPGLREGLGSFLGVPLMSGAKCSGVLSAVSPLPDHYDEGDERLAILLAAIAAPWVEVARLSRLSTVDPLTGALNRRGLDTSFPEVETVDARIEPLSVVMADLDHFKAVNDHFGHAAGDEVLKAVAARFAELMRLGDAVVRFGGEEFLLVLPRASLEHAAQVAERARKSLGAEPVRAGDAVITVTASFGVAERLPDEGREGVIARADAALYRAKAAGRDRVERAR